MLDLLPIAQLHRRIFQGLMLACQRSTLIHGRTVRLVLAQLSFKQAYFQLNYQDLMVADLHFDWQETFASNLWLTCQELFVVNLDLISGYLRLP